MRVTVWAGKQPVREHLEQHFRIIFERLNEVKTQEALTPSVSSRDNASTSRTFEIQEAVKWRAERRGTWYGTYSRKINR
jgi:hypothetical protein